MSPSRLWLKLEYLPSIVPRVPPTISVDEPCLTSFHSAGIANHYGAAVYDSKCDICFVGVEAN